MTVVVEDGGEAVEEATEAATEIVEEATEAATEIIEEAAEAATEIIEAATDAVGGASEGAPPWAMELVERVTRIEERQDDYATRDYVDAVVPSYSDITATATAVAEEVAEEVVEETDPEDASDTVTVVTPDVDEGKKRRSFSWRRVW